MSDQDTLLTLAETAARMRKSPAALRWMIQQGTAPRSGVIGGRRYFRATEVEAFIAAAFDFDDQVNA